MAQQWLWNEFRQIGTDYASVDEVASYDRRMRDFRDIDAENRQLLEQLALKHPASLLEIGIGTGAFARVAAAAGHRVLGVDISPVMLKYSAAMAERAGFTDMISHTEAGFLSFPETPDGFDGAVSSLALHHLPDLWKHFAVRKIFGALKPGARFLLQDVVFDPRSAAPEEYFPSLLPAAGSSRGNFERHIACEYSTLDWIMRGLLESNGFQLINHSVTHGFLHLYTALKPEAAR